MLLDTLSRADAESGSGTATQVRKKRVRNTRPGERGMAVQRDAAAASCPDCPCNAHAQSPARTRRVPARGFLCHAGESFHSAYLVRCGFLKHVVRLEDGREQVIGFSMSGDLVGLEGFDQDRHGADMIALEDTQVCVLGRAELGSSRQWSISRLLGQQILQAQLGVQLLALSSAEARVAAFLLHLSKRYEMRGYSAQCFSLRMKRSDMASYLGLVPETVCRVLRKFVSAQVVRFEGGRQVIHCDLSALNRIANAGERDGWVPTVHRLQHGVAADSAVD